MNVLERPQRLDRKVDTVNVKVPRPFGVKLLAALPVVLALVSIPPGIELLRDPSGSSMGIQFIVPTLSQTVPFVHDLVPVGAWLIGVYGVFPVVLAAGVWTLRRWARYGSVLLGATMVTWIGTELVLFYSFGFTFFYPLIAGMGVAILALALVPTVRHSLYR